MILTPLSGYLFVTAGDYGIGLFGLHDLVNPIGKKERLADIARIVHIVISYALVVIASWHVGLGLKYHIFDRDRLLHRMLPFIKRWRRRQ